MDIKEIIARIEAMPVCRDDGIQAEEDMSDEEATGFIRGGVHMKHDILDELRSLDV